MNGSTNVLMGRIPGFNGRRLRNRFVNECTVFRLGTNMSFDMQIQGVGCYSASVLCKPSSQFY